MHQQPRQKMTRDEAAYRIWPVLISQAANCASISYSKLADEIGSRDRRLGWPLGLIQEFCVNEQLPPLTLIVVRKGTGAPGHGFTAWDLAERQEGERRVFDQVWPTENPFAYAKNGTRLEAIVKALLASPAEAEQVYATVPVRGWAQKVFQLAVLGAYDYQCAMCGLSYVECLEAAHIIPWPQATPAQRVSPSNGLCLCANHHKMFDAGMLTLDPQGLIVSADHGDANEYNDSDRALSAELHGKRALLPDSKGLRPAPESLLANYEQYGWSAAPWSLKI